MNALEGEPLEPGFELLLPMQCGRVGEERARVNERAEHFATHRWLTNTHSAMFALTISFISYANR